MYLWLLPQKHVLAFKPIFHRSFQCSIVSFLRFTGRIPLKIVDYFFHKTENRNWTPDSLFDKFQIFFSNFTLFLNFYSSSNGQKARKPWSATFSSIILCKSRFFPTKKKNKKKKNWFWALCRVSVAIVTFWNFLLVFHFIGSISPRGTSILS